MTESAYVLAIEIGFISVKDATDEHFEAFLDEVLAQLENIDRNVSLAARLAERVASFAVTIDAATAEEEQAAFLVDLRTALHAAGCETSRWPQFVVREQSVHELQPA